MARWWGWVMGEPSDCWDIPEPAHTWGPVSHSDYAKTPHLPCLRSRSASAELRG